METNHPGLVLFDEPRQQSANTVSFGALLARAGGQRAESQVVFVTSEEVDTLKRLLANVPHSLRSIDGYLLTRTGE